MAVEANLKVEEYFAKYPKRFYPKGQIIIHAGDEPQHIYYVVKGKVRQYDITYRGEEVIVNLLRTGSYFPMQWALTGLQNKFFYSAEQDSEMIIAPKDETIVFLKANPDVLFDLLTRVYVGMDGMLGRVVQLMSGTAQSRLVYELIIECRRFGEFAKDGGCSISVNESDLASRAGLSRETVSREMQKLIKHGLVYVSHSGIIVRNLEELEIRLGSEK